jgi:hypothetical protein
LLLTGTNAALAGRSCEEKDFSLGSGTSGVAVGRDETDSEMIGVLSTVVVCCNCDSLGADIMVAKLGAVIIYTSPPSD